MIKIHDVACDLCGSSDADFLNKVRNVTKCQVFGIDISKAAWRYVLGEKMMF